MYFLDTVLPMRRHWDISSSERLEILRRYVNYGLEHWGSDTQVSPSPVMSRFAHNSQDLVDSSGHPGHSPDNTVRNVLDVRTTPAILSLFLLPCFTSRVLKPRGGFYWSGSASSIGTSQSACSSESPKGSMSVHQAMRGGTSWKLS